MSYEERLGDLMEALNDMGGHACTYHSSGGGKCENWPRTLISYCPPCYALKTLRELG
jgi:hypothetical protein